MMSTSVSRWQCTLPPQPPSHQMSIESLAGEFSERISSTNEKVEDNTNGIKHLEVVLQDLMDANEANLLDSKAGAQQWLSNTQFLRHVTYSSFHNDQPTVREKVFEMLASSKGLLQKYVQLLRAVRIAPFNNASIESESPHRVITQLRSPGLVNLVRLQDVVWNTSDKREDFCSTLFESEALDLIFDALRNEEMLSCNILLNSNNLCRLVNGSLGILGNIIQSSSLHGARERFRCLNCCVALNRYIDCPVLSIKTKTLLLLSYVVDEEENRCLHATMEHLEYIIGVLSDALMDTGGTHYSHQFGFHAEELLRGLINIAAEDSNKEKLVKAGLLEQLEHLVMVEVNCGRRRDEMRWVAQLLWSLAYDDLCCAAVLARPNLIKALEQWAEADAEEDTSNDKQVVCDNEARCCLNSAAGALAQLRGVLRDRARFIPLDKLSEYSDSLTNCNTNGHVMLSYNHAYQASFLQIASHLRSEGYSVWLDADEMIGTTLDAMAEAIEGAIVVIIGVCNAYKISPYCRSEALYAFHRRVAIVPLRMESNYTPDGWLGILTAEKMYFDFSSDHLFEESLRALCKELGGRGKKQMADKSGLYERSSSSMIYSAAAAAADMYDSSSNSMNHMFDARTFEHSMTFAEASPQIMALRTARNAACSSPEIGALVSLQTSSASGISVKRGGSRLAKQVCETPAFVRWTQEEVFQWLQREDLLTIMAEHCKMFHFNGELLFELAKMRADAPEAFFQALHRDWNLQLCNQLRVSRALSRLLY